MPTEPRSNTLRQELFRRHPDNPILSAEQWPYLINTVFNAGATRLANGETLLLCRCEDTAGRSHLTAARSADGVTNWRVDERPTFAPDVVGHPEEVWGVEDPRVVWVPELEKYVIAYTCYSPSGAGVSLATTEDFVNFERLGNIMPPEDKDASLFPRRFNGRWALIHRPVPTHGRAHMWVSYSPDLKHWGDHTITVMARRGPFWDANKIGLSSTPIETPEGWLVIYHGVKLTPAGAIYRLGLTLLDLEDPAHSILRSESWIMAPRETYERMGEVHDVVFPCGHTIGDDGDTINLYYGAADTSISLATGSIKEILAWLRENASPGKLAE
ncbi:MAG: glycosidase [FCB group bacterium]|jgi:predicted GH43/DUF377 family glycosyl hydrolase|nr:glycosidase [FCB group bacterium]